MTTRHTTSIYEAVASETVATAFCSLSEYTGPHPTFAIHCTACGIVAQHFHNRDYAESSAHLHEKLPPLDPDPGKHDDLPYMQEEPEAAT